MRLGWMKDRFCVFCANAVKAYYICQSCLEEKEKIAFENMEKTKDAKRRKGVLLSLKWLRYSLLIQSITFGSGMLLAVVCVFPPVWKVVRNQALELQVFTILPFYLSSFTGMYLGFKIYPKFIKSPLFLPRIFYKDYNPGNNFLSKILFVSGVLLDTFKQPFLLLERFLPLIVPALIFLFFPFRISGLLNHLPFHPYIKANLLIWILTFSTNFYVGILFIWPPLYDFLYTDWAPLIIKKLRENYA